MTDLVVLAGSAAVVALMVGVAALLGFRQAARVDEAELQKLLAGADPDARLAETLIAPDNRSAIARLADGKVLVAKVMGDRVTLRIAPQNALTVGVGAQSVRVRFADLGFPGLHIKLNADPPRWLADLAAGGGGNA